MTNEELQAIRERYEQGEGELDDVPALLAEVARLTEERAVNGAQTARLRQALAAVPGVNNGAGNSYCPWCRRMLTGPFALEHRPDCQRQAALGLLP
jgi:hypothetical protein